MTRLKSNARRDQILTAAIELSERNGYTHVTRAEIAQRCECSPAVINVYFSTMAQLRRDVMRAAIRNRNLTIIAQGLVARDPHAKRADDDLKRAAVASINV